jgi:hypothetical protein
MDDRAGDKRFTEGYGNLGSRVDDVPKLVMCRIWNEADVAQGPDNNQHKALKLERRMETYSSELCSALRMLASAHFHDGEPISHGSMKDE